MSQLEEGQDRRMLHDLTKGYGYAKVSQSLSFFQMYTLHFLLKSSDVCMSSDACKQL